MTPARSLKKSILNSNKAGKICLALGIDPRQYRILLNLFNILGNRLEFMNVKMDQSKIAGFYGLFSILLSLYVFTDPPLHRYLLVFIGLTMFILLMNIFQDAANSLMNPDEASILAHQPVRGATYVAAKLTHLLAIVAVMVPALNMVPALAGVFLAEAHWYYPITHLAAAYLAGLFIAFFVCGIYGWMFLLVSPVRLKHTILWLQVILPMLFLASFSVGRPLITDNERVASIVTDIFSASWMPWRWFVAVGLFGHVEYDGWILGEALIGCILTIVLILFGLRAFRADYLIKTTSLIQGRTVPVVSSHRVSRFGVLVRKITGAPSGYGAYSFISILCRRDWNFRRQVLMNGVIFICFGLASGIAGIWISPFGSMDEATPGFSLFHLFPHLLGLVLVFACSLISYTSEPQGVAVFIRNPIPNYRVFIRGFYLLPFVYIILLPHFLLIGPCLWSWGIFHALLFFTYSIFLSTFYLALAFFFVEGFPFVNPFKPSRFAEMQISLFGAMILIGIIAVIQWFVFHSTQLATGVTGGVAILAVSTLLISMRRMEKKARENLQLLNLSPQSIFRETD